MKRSPWMRPLAAAAALLLVATACETDEETAEPEIEPEAEPEVEEDPEEEPEEEPELEDEEVEEVESDNVLNMGYILPESGPLAFLGPPQIQAVELAVEDINAAGGVLGEEVTLSGADEAGDTTIAAESAQRLIGGGVNVIVGAAASGMSLAFADAVTSAGVLQCSGSNTAPTFTDLDLNGLYFRTAPTDALQGPVLAELIVADGNSNPAILARADDYGRGLLEATVAELEQQGASVAAQISYDPEAATFDAEVGEAAGSGADSVVVIAFDEGAQILASMVEAGIGPAELPVYGADGVRSNELAGLVDPGDESVLDGMKGTAPSPEASPDFLQRFQDETELDDTTFAAQAYDCAVLTALAAEAAGSDLGSDIAAEMVAVTTGDTECETVEECLEAIRNGESVAYQTASGVVLMETDTGNGEPESGEYEVWEIDDTGSVSTIETVISGF
jgi:ABC-type branched-subunit amino acid transport system substrate-binding protein